MYVISIIKKRRMNWKTAFIVTVVIIVSSNTFGQTKYEKEYRLKETEVPEIAKRFVNSLDSDAKVKWYFEENLAGNSIEAKLKYNRNKYSVEFDTSGNLQDIEIEKDYSEIPEVTRIKLDSSLDSIYLKHVIRKVQAQYSGKISTLSEFVRTENPDNLYDLRYELIVKGRKNRGWKLYEITCNKNGEIVSTSEIVFRNTDNLEY